MPVVAGGHHDQNTACPGMVEGVVQRTAAGQRVAVAPPD
jgi:hypothetical protein